MLSILAVLAALLALWLVGCTLTETAFVLVIVTACAFMQNPIENAIHRRTNRLPICKSRHYHSVSFLFACFIIVPVLYCFRDLPTPLYATVPFIAVLVGNALAQLLLGERRINIER